MRILQIVPGSGGGFYCQNCLRDLALTEALRRQGADATILPLYLPLAAQPPSATQQPVFYGAVGLYLRHRFPRLARALPAALWRALDARPVLRLAARQSESTQADGLADLTLSMLRGEHGRQADELERLATWLRDTPEQRPDVIVLSNALLLGLARRLHAVLGAPVLCWLQDEDVWMDAMTPADAQAVWRVLAERAADVQAWVAVSAAYAAAVGPRLGLAGGRTTILPIGVDVAGYRPADVTRRPPVVGYLGRLAAEEGFGLFTEAFIHLHRDPRWQDVRMQATGGLPGNAGFLRAQQRNLVAAGLTEHAVIDPLRFQADRAGFLASLTVFSAPAPRGDAGALNVIEALAAGVPAVQPDAGAYREILNRAGCGTLYSPHTPQALAAAWAALLSDPVRLASEARASRAGAARDYSLDGMAARFVALCRELVPRA